MGQNPHHRRSIRLRGYDYRQPGAYFVTICARDRQPIFGEIVGGEMRSNAWGQIVAGRNGRARANRVPTWNWVPLP